VELTKERTTIAGGQEVLLRWLEQSTHPADLHCDGWVTHMVEATSGETFVGHLRVSYVTRESSFAAAPDGLHFMSEHRGWCLSFDDPKELWCRAHLYASKTPKSLLGRPNPPATWSLSRSIAPSPAVLEQDLLELHKIGERERELQLRRSSNPVVAFVRVDDGDRTGINWRRRGIGQEMYRFAAQELGTRGLVLMASSLQSPDAQALWARFESDPEMPTRQIRVPGSERSSETRLVLDYRNQAQSA
jgi:hypothetical protein